MGVEGRRPEGCILEAGTRSGARGNMQVLTGRLEALADGAYGQAEREHRRLIVQVPGSEETSPALYVKVPTYGGRRSAAYIWQLLPQHLLHVLCTKQRDGRASSKHAAWGDVSFWTAVHAPTGNFFSMPCRLSVWQPQTAPRWVEIAMREGSTGELPLEHAYFTGRIVFATRSGNPRISRDGVIGREGFIARLDPAPGAGRIRFGSVSRLRTALRLHAMS